MEVTHQPLEDVQQWMKCSFSTFVFAYFAKVAQKHDNVLDLPLGRQSWPVSSTAGAEGGDRRGCAIRAPWVQKAREQKDLEQEQQEPGFFRLPGRFFHIVPVRATLLVQQRGACFPNEQQQEAKLSFSKGLKCM